MTENTDPRRREQDLFAEPPDDPQEGAAPEDVAANDGGSIPSAQAEDEPAAASRTDQETTRESAPSPAAPEAESLFDLMGDAGKQFQKPKPPRPAPRKPEPKRYPRVPVRYAGYTIELPREGMTAEEIHAFLEDDWPELGKDRSELVFDEKARPDMIFAVVKGHRKGASALSGKPLTVLREAPQEAPPYPPLFHLLAKDGVYEVRHTPAGGFAAHVDAAVEMREGFYLSAPKAPAALLAEVVAAFKAVPHEEALVNVVYDRATGEHSLRWPAQERSAAGVLAAYTPEDGECFVLCQIHSHGTMRPFWSSRDDEDEVRTGLYGVIGNVDAALPAALFRYSCGGLYREVPAESIFSERFPGELLATVAA
jgi:PRTRC genetic system protein A